MYVCLCVMLVLQDVVHIGRLAFRRSYLTPPSGRLYFVTTLLPCLRTIELLFCSYYIQLSATLLEQLRTIVDNVMRRLFDCPKLRNTRPGRRYTLLWYLPVLRGNFDNSKETIKILTDSTKYQGYLCDNVVYPEILLTRNT